MLQKAQFEIVARNEYTKSEIKNPVDCSLFYLALKKKTVLQGLWRMATWNKEQGATQKLLANNFEDPKWKTTALKNAYALLSKRRFGKSSQGGVQLEIYALTCVQRTRRLSSCSRTTCKMLSTSV
jgi:hypothetical protein